LGPLGLRSRWLATKVVGGEFMSTSAFDPRRTVRNEMHSLLSVNGRQICRNLHFLPVVRWTLCIYKLKIERVTPGEIAEEVKRTNTRKQVRCILSGEFRAIPLHYE
jgi:hypothetical protein